MQNPFNFFNLSDFKKWVNNHSEEDNKKSSMVGMKVKAKNNIENFEEKIEIEMGDELEVVKEFIKNGGVVSEQEGNKFLIDVESGSFVCHKRFIKKIN